MGWKFLGDFSFSKFAVALLFSLLPLFAHGAAIWDGDAGDGDWSTPANWEGDQLPNPDAEIILPASFGAIHVTGTATVDNSLEIGLGTTLVVDSAAVLTVDGTIAGDGDLTNEGLIQQGTNGTGRFGWYSEYFKGYLLNNGTIDSLLIRRFRSPDAATDNYGTIQYASIELDASGVVLNNYGSIVDSNIEIGTEMFSSTYTRPRFDNLPGGSVTGGTITAGYSEFGSGHKQGALHNQGSIAGAGISVLTEFINEASGTIDLIDGFLRVNCYGYNLLAKNFGTITGGTVGNSCSVWYGEGDGDSWSHPLNWSMGIVPDGSSYVKIVMASGETARIHLDVDLTQVRVMNLNGPGLTLVIDPGVTLDLNTGGTSLGRIVDMRSAAIVNDGTLINHHLFDSGYSNSPTIASTIENNGLLQNYGKLNNFTGSSLINNATLTNAGILNTWGAFNNTTTGSIDNTVGEIFSYCGASYLDEGIFAGNAPLFLCGIWDGDAGDGDWSTPANWEGDQLPNPDAEIILPASFGAIHVTGTATVDNSLEIGLGTTLVVDSAAVLTVDGTIAGDGDLTNEGLIQQGTNGTGRFGWYSEYFKGYLLNNGTIDSLLIRRFRSPDAATDNYGTIQYASIELDASGVVLNNYGSIVDSNIEIGTEMFSSTYTRPRFDNLPGGSVTGGTITAGYSEFGSGHKQGALHNQGSIAGAGISVLTEFINEASGTIDLIDGFLRVNCYGYNLLAKNFGTITGGTVGNSCSVWYGEGDGDSWSHPLNWSMGIVPDGSSYVKIVMASGETARIHLDVDLTQVRVMNLNGPGLTLVIDPGVTLDLNTGGTSLGRIVDMRSAAIVNDGTLINHHLFDSGYSNSPTIASTIENNGLLQNYGKLNNFEGSVIHNTGTLDTALGSVENYGSIDNQCGGTVVGTINQNPVNYASCDTTPPVIAVPLDITIEATSDAGATVIFAVTAIDETDGAVTPSCSSGSGDVFAIGMTLVTCTASDSAGNEASEIFYVTVRDTTPPTLTVPADITADATSPAGAIVTFAADAADNVGVESLTCVPTSGTTFPIGSTPVTCTAADAAGNTAPASFNVMVVNLAPLANEDYVVTDEDTAVIVDVLANDSDANGDPLTTTSLTNPSNGIAKINSDGTINYTPNADFNGTDSFTYTVSDGNGGSATATVSVTIIAVNDVPVANDDTASTNEDTAVTTNVRGNDSDVDVGDILSVSANSQGSNGSVICGTSSCTYTPNAEFNGTDSYTYTISDGNGGSATATVSVTIIAVNDAPVANDDTASTNEDTAVMTNVLGNDSDVDVGDILSVSSNSQGSNGSVSCGTSSCTYTPNADFNGTDSYTYTVSDGNGGSATATVSVTIVAVNDAPVANDDSYATNEDMTLNVSAPGALSNDVDMDGDSLTAILVGGPSKGSLTLNGDGSFSYTPNADYFGSDSFAYKANDGLADSSVATVTITINAVNDPPVIQQVTPTSQTVDYSDNITDVIIMATDVDSPVLILTDSGRPASLTLSGGCARNNAVPAGTGGNCSWTLSGVVTVPQAMHTVGFTVTDDGGRADAASTDINVEAEDATATLYEDNPVALQVASEGGNSGPFNLTVVTREKLPDNAHAGASAAGIITRAVVTITLDPVGPGSPISGACNTTPMGTTGYGQLLETVCIFDDVPVNTYSVMAGVNGVNYYTGGDEDALTVYDPSLGFTTGGGWFYWPGTDDRTNFGYTMKYGKNGRNVQGNLILIRHTDTGKYRIKSNALEGLALGEGGTSPDTFGWASFSGKSTYIEPGWLDAVGNYEFTVYVENIGEPGAGVDRFWLEVRDKDRSVVSDLSMDEPADANAETIDGGNIVVPHTSGGGGRDNGKKN